MLNQLKTYSFSSIVFSIFLVGITMFPKLEALLIIILLLLWVYEKQFKSKIQYLFSNKVFLLLPLLYVLYLLGMFYTQNVDYGWRKMETRLAIFILPIILPTLNSLKFKKNYTFYTNCFIAGIIFSMFFCIIRSSSLFGYELYCREHRIILDEYPYTNYFFSSYLSYFMHYGYYAMYVNIAIIILLERISSNFVQFSVRTRMLYIFILIMLSIFVMMLYSKAGIIALLIIYLLFGIYLILKYKKIKYLIYSFLMIVFLITVLLKFIPHTAERFSMMLSGIEQKELDPTSEESTQLRMFAWKSALTLIKEKIVFGYGTGDESDILIKHYEKMGYTGVLKKELNAHNQYFQTMLAIGLLGCSVLIGFLLYLGFLGWKYKLFPLYTFSMVTFVVLFFESYLSTLAGVLYVSVFSTLFLILKNKFHEQYD